MALAFMGGHARVTGSPPGHVGGDSPHGLGGVALVARPGTAPIAGGAVLLGVRPGASRGVVGPYPGWTGRGMYFPGVPQGLGRGVAGYRFPGLSSALLGPWALPLGLRVGRWGTARLCPLLPGRRALFPGAR